MKVTPIRPEDWKDPGFRCPTCKGELKVVTHENGDIQKWCEAKGCASGESWLYTNPANFKPVKE